MRAYEARRQAKWNAVANQVSADRALSERRARAWTDPECRYARTDGRHICTRRDGRELQPGEPCHAEASAQVYEQGAVLRAAEPASYADLLGVADQCRPPESPPDPTQLPQYEWTQR